MGLALPEEVGGMLEEEPMEGAAPRSTWGCRVLAEEGESSSTLHAFTSEMSLQGTQ